MRRKIVQHGSSSLTITLPVKWAEKFNIKKGDELEVEESGPTLLIHTQQSAGNLKKEVSTSDSGIFTKNNLSHLYQLGYDEIIIHYQDTQTLEEIKKRLPECIGYEIIDQRDGCVIIKSIATALDTEFDTLLRKSFLVIQEMGRGIFEAVEKKNPEKLREIRSLEALNNRFTDVCIRILNKRGYKIQKRTLQMHSIVKNLERIADEYKGLCDVLSRKKPEKESLASIKSAFDYYGLFYEMFYKFSPELKKKIYNKRKELQEKFTRQLLAGKNPELFHHLLNVVEKTYDSAGAYFALVL